MKDRSAMDVKWRIKLGSTRLVVLRLLKGV